MSLNFYLSFLDTYSGFHQISMATKDEETISFVTPRGLCCYMNIPYRLKKCTIHFCAHDIHHLRHHEST
jgi:hypothetical protein